MKPYVIAFEAHPGQRRATGFCAAHPSVYAPLSCHFCWVAASAGIAGRSQMLPG